MSLERLLEEVAAPTPAPGGGACSGWAAALAAALIEMAAGITEARTDDDARGRELAGISSRAAGLRSQAMQLADADRDSYGPVLAAQRSGDAAALELALAHAADVPFALAGVGAELADLAQQVLELGRPSLRGDALTALELARASCRAAASLAQLNLERRSADPRLAELQTLLQHVGSD